MAKAVGLDIGAHHVRLVEIDGGAKGVRVLRLGEREIVNGEEPDREEAVREAVDALFQETHASRAEVVMSWPAEACTIREIDVPFIEDDQIRKVIKFEFESHLHSDSIDDVVVDYLSTGETAGGTRLLTIGASKAPLKTRLTSLDMVRVDPVAVDVDVASLVDAASVAGVLETHPTAVMVDVGARSTKIVLVVDGTIRTARAMRGGIDGLTQRLETDLDGGPDAAAAALESAPRPDDLMAVADTDATEAILPPAETSAATLQVAVVEDRRTDFVDRLVREISRTLATAAPGLSFPTLLISGRGSTVAGIQQELETALTMDVEPLSLFQNLESPVPPESLEEANAVYAVALGAAVRAIGQGPAHLDLRKEDLAFARRFEQVKGGISAILALLLLGVGGMLWRAKNEKDVSEREYRDIVTHLGTVSDKVENKYSSTVGKELAARLPKTSGEYLKRTGDSRRR
ncbi:MAG: pilus assembly protein PilM, partial [Planctomycetota bacterium]